MKILKTLIAILFLIIFLYTFIYPMLIPISYLKKENPKMTAMMKYRLKQWEREGKKVKIKQIWVPLNKISPYLKKAVLIAEDDKFYYHEGFDLDAIMLAVEKNIKAGKLKYGGSTISQQLAKNLFLSPSKNPIRKIQEAIITFRLEKTLPKNRILELYLNVAEWGEGIFGIEAASRHYFGKPSLELNPWESALLAAILPNPIKYNPLNPSSYVQKRAKLIYFIMKKRGIIKEEYKEVTEEAETQPSEENKTEEISPQEQIFQENKTLSENQTTL